MSDSSRTCADSSKEDGFSRTEGDERRRGPLTRHFGPKVEKNLLFEEKQNLVTWRVRGRGRPLRLAASAAGRGRLRGGRLRAPGRRSTRGAKRELGSGRPSAVTGRRRRLASRGRRRACRACRSRTATRR